MAIIPFPQNQAEMKEYRRRQSAGEIKFDGKNWVTVSTSPKKEKQVSKEIEQTVKNIQKGVGALTEQVKTEGVTDEAGKFLIKPTGKQFKLTSSQQERFNLLGKGTSQTTWTKLLNQLNSGEITLDFYKAEIKSRVGAEFQTPISSAEAPTEPTEPTETPKDTPDGTTDLTDKFNEFIEGLDDNNPLKEFSQFLDDQSMQMLGLSLMMSEVEDKDTKDRLAEALKLAKESADPFFKTQIDLVVDATQRSLGSLEADLTAQEGTLARLKGNIEDDLAFNKKDISTEHAAEMSRLNKRVDVQLEDTRNNMANRGLTFSTIRGRAEELLQESKQDVIESAERTKARQLRAQGVGAERQLATIDEQTEKLRRTFGEQKTELGRGVEATLGTDIATQKLGGLTPFFKGGVQGQLEETKQRDILSRSQSLLSAGLV